MTCYNVFKDMIIPLLAAILGGSITLVGVYLTIRKSDQKRKEDETKKARPLFSFHGFWELPIFNSATQHICISDSSESNKYECDVYVELENSNQSSFEIKRIFHDDVWVCVEGNTVVLPNDKCILNFRFSDNPTCLFLEVEDILFNKYYYQLFVLEVKLKTYEGKYLHTIREIKSISKKDMGKIIKEHC